MLSTHTTGQSKCPHEEGTAAIDDPSLSVSQPTQAVFPDEAMVFELTMSNLGVGNESNFVLYARDESNSGGLELKVDGAPFEDAVEFTNIAKDKEYKKTLVSTTFYY